MIVDNASIKAILDKVRQNNERIFELFIRLYVWEDRAGHKHGFSLWDMARQFDIPLELVALRVKFAKTVLPQEELEEILQDTLKISNS